MMILNDRGVQCDPNAQKEGDAEHRIRFDVIEWVEFREGRVAPGQAAPAGLGVTRFPPAGSGRPD